jgi:hypothetical protein
MLTDAEVIRRYFLKMLGEEKDLGGVFLYQYLEFLTLSVDQLEEQGKRKESQAYLCQRVAELVHVEVKFELRTDTEVHSELQELSTACLQRRRERREISYPERWRGARAIRTTRAQDPVGQRHLQSRPSLYIVEAPPIGEEETSHSISLPALPVQ